jgi:hypothetical protein
MSSAPTQEDPMQTHDFLNFDKLIAPTLIKFVYWAGLVLILLFTLWRIFMELGFGFFGGGIIHFFFVIIAGAVAALAWRIICELWIVIFSINDRLGVIAGQKQIN